jgi:hypothetical protein
MATAALAALLAVGGGCGGRVPLDSAGGGGSFASGAGGGSGGASTAAIGGTAGAGGTTPGTGGSGGIGGSSGWKGGPPPCRQDAKAFAPARIWLLSDEQYVNVVRDVLGIVLAGHDAEITGFGSDEGEYRNEADAVTFTDALAMSYQAAAEKVSAQATTPSRMAFLLGSATPTEAQVKEFLSTKVARLWRRPVSAADVTKLFDIYRMGLVDGAARGFALVIEAVLQAPAFLFRTELGAADGSAKLGEVVLNPYEHASALSFLFTDSSPDDALWEKATNATLSDPVVAAAQVDRLLSLPVTKDQLARYASYWLSIEKVPYRDRNAGLFPEFDADLRAALLESGRAFVREVVLDGRLSDLVTSNKIYVNDVVGAAYGIAGARGSGLVPVASPLRERGSGLLTQPALFVAMGRGAATNPIQRGLFIYNRLLCGADGGYLPAPPADSFGIAAMMKGNERQLAEQRLNMSPCVGCHIFIDPLGLTMERYDAIGRYDASRYVLSDYQMGGSSWVTSPVPIDASAMIPAALGADLTGPVQDIGELAQRLAGDIPRKRLAYCAVTRLSRFALGYDVNSEFTCGLQDVKQRFYETGSFMQFYKDLATSPGFTTRRPQKS